MKRQPGTLADAEQIVGAAVTAFGRGAKSMLVAPPALSVAGTLERVLRDDPALAGAPRMSSPPADRIPVRVDRRASRDLKDNLVMSLQGRTIAIRGSVECVEDVLIEGRIEGHIWNENHVVTVGADASVTGDIVARQITVRGAVEGTLMATGRVDIMNEARVAGRVLSKSLMLADGAQFNGKAEPQHLDAALKVARHRRTEAAAGSPAKASA